jgi:hypothetical protein
MLQGFSSHLNQILPLDQRGEAAGYSRGNGNRSAEAFRYSQGKVLDHQASRARRPERESGAAIWGQQGAPPPTATRSEMTRTSKRGARPDP